MPARHPAAARLGTPLALLLLVFGILLAGTGNAAAAETPPGASWVRSVHLVTGAGPMQVSVTPAGGGSPTVLSPRLAYGSATDYRAFPPGQYTVEVRAEAAGADAVAVLSSTFEATAGGAVSLTLLGSSDNPRLAVLQDDLTAPAAGQARVRVLPAAGDVPQLTLTAQDGPVIARDAVLGQPTAYTAVPAGSWPLSAVGGDRRGAQTVTLDSGGVYTVLVADAVGGGLRVSALQDAAGIDSSGMAVAAPQGGVQTGGGGAAELISASPSAAFVSTAPADPVAPQWWLLALAPLGALAPRVRRALPQR